jgi:hypothetical protein
VIVWYCFQRTLGLPSVHCSKISLHSYWGEIFDI